MAYHNYAEAKRRHQVQKYFIQTVRSVKTTAYGQNNNIQCKELFSLCPNHFQLKWNRRFRGLTMFVSNFGVESLEHCVKLGRLVIFDFLGNSLL